MMRKPFTRPKRCDARKCLHGRGAVRGMQVQARREIPRSDPPESRLWNGALDSKRNQHGLWNQPDVQAVGFGMVTQS